MHFDNIDIEQFLSDAKSFSLEGFNVFYTGQDNLPHIVCACPNKSVARAILALLEIAKKAMPRMDA